MTVFFSVRTLLIAGIWTATGISPVGAGEVADAVLFDDSEIVSKEHPSWFKTSFLDLGEDLAEAREDGKQGLMLFFDTEGCAYCKAFLKHTLDDPGYPGRRARELRCDRPGHVQRCRSHRFLRARITSEGVRQDGRCDRVADRRVSRRGWNASVSRRRLLPAKSVFAPCSTTWSAVTTRNRIIVSIRPKRGRKLFLVLPSR